MHKKSLNRLAAVAAGTMVAGLAVPILGATAASAATTPTSLAVTPTSATVAPGGSQSFKVTLNSGATNVNGIFYAITSGPDASPTTPNAGTSLNPLQTSADTSVTGSVPHGPNPGTDTIVFFSDTNGDTTYESTEPHTSAALTVNGAISSVALAPSSQSVATATNAAYSVTTKDSSGNPATGTVSVTVSQTVATAAGSPNLRVTSPASTSTAFPATGTAATTTAVSGSNTTYSETFTVTQGLDGTGSFDVASDAAGTVSVSIAPTVSTNGASSTLTVTPGNTSSTASVSNNDMASSLTVSPTTSTAIVGGVTPNETVTVKNSAGDLLGGVQVSASVDGAAATTAVTDAAGVAKFPVTRATAGTANFDAYVEQDTNGASNATGPNAGEPQGTATVTFSTLPTGAAMTATAPSPTGTSANPTVPASQATEAVTFHLTSTASPNGLAGQTINIAHSGLPTGVTVTPSSGTTTDANGNVVVTVAHTAGTPDTVTVTGTLNGTTTTAASSTVTFATAAASSLTLTPAAQTKAVGSTVTETATLVDQFGNGIAGQSITFTVTGRNSVINNTGAVGTATTDSNGVATFTYTDKGPALTAPATGTDQVAASGDGQIAPLATVTYVAGTATAATVTLGAASATATTTADPSATGTATVTDISATVKDSNGALLANVPVTFNSSGVGVFADATGHPAGTTVTVPTNGSGIAVAHVRSTTNGTQSVTATAGGITSSAVTVTYTNSNFTAVTPDRLVDTRSGQGGVHNGALAPNTLYTFDPSLTTAPTPANLKAYVFNVTAVGATGVGNLRIGPAGTVPTTSIVNYQPGASAVANDVIVPVGTSGQIALYTDHSSANVILDLQGYYTATGFTAASANGPQRVVTSTPLTPNTLTELHVGNANTPVALNVTVSQPQGVGNLRVAPGGTTIPPTSNINYIKGVDKAAFVVVTPDANGNISVYSDHSAANVIVDLFGTLDSVTVTSLSTPVRVVPTSTALNPGTPYTFTATGTATGVPADAQAVLVSLTAVHNASSIGVGNLRIYPGGTAEPTVSNVNYVSKTADVANFAIVKLGANGTLTVATAGSPINVAVDIMGYVPAGS